jgi:hypothetical protein
MCKHVCIHYTVTLYTVGFADELLKKTSGSGTTPQLKFSHWGKLTVVSAVQLTTHTAIDT